MGARLECHINFRSARKVTCLRKSVHFSMSGPRLPMPTFAYYLSIFDDYAADGRVGRGPAHTTAGKSECASHHSHVYFNHV